MIWLAELVLVRVGRFGHVFVALRVWLSWVFHVILPLNCLQNAYRVRSAQSFFSWSADAGATALRRAMRIFM